MFSKLGHRSRRIIRERADAQSTTKQTLCISAFPHDYTLRASSVRKAFTALKGLFIQY